jgi:hypothetical protein
VPPEPTEARAEAITSGMALYALPANLRAQRLCGSFGFVRDPKRDWEYEPGRWLWAFQLTF